MRHQTERGRWGDLWWEVLVALLIVCGLAWAGWHATQPGGGWIQAAISSRGLPAAFLVGILAVMIAQLYWPLRRSLGFWAMVAGFLSVFGATAYAWFSIAGTGLRGGIWIVAIGFLEFLPFAYLAYRKFHFIPKTQRRGSRRTH